MAHAPISRLPWWSLAVPIVACALFGLALGDAAGKFKVNV